MGEAAVKEPSMEDILSSIRKIISEEGNEPQAEQAVQAQAAPMPAPEPEVPVAPEPVAEEVSAPQMSDVLEQVRAEEPAPEPQQPASATSDEISGNDAAKMAASLASIAETVKADMPAEPEVAEAAERAQAPTASVWDDVAEPAVAETIAPEPEPAIEMPAPVEAVTEAVASQEAAPSLASIAETVVEQVEVPEAPVAAAIAETPVETPAEPEIHVEMAEATPAPVVEEPAPATLASTVETMVEEEMAFKGALMSPSADSAVAGSLDRLKRSAMDDIDAKVEAVIRPMLREWLDENLPNMVERLVREEIERVARG